MQGQRTAVTALATNGSNGSAPAACSEAAKVSDESAPDSLCAKPVDPIDGPVEDVCVYEL